MSCLSNPIPQLDSHSLGRWRRFSVYITALVILHPSFSPLSPPSSTPLSPLSFFRSLHSVFIFSAATPASPTSWPSSASSETPSSTPTHSEEHTGLLARDSPSVGPAVSLTDEQHLHSARRWRPMSNMFGLSPLKVRCLWGRTGWSGSAFRRHPFCDDGSVGQTDHAHRLVMTSRREPRGEARHVTPSFIMRTE